MGGEKNRRNKETGRVPGQALSLGVFSAGRVSAAWLVIQPRHGSFEVARWVLGGLMPERCFPYSCRLNVFLPSYYKTFSSRWYLPGLTNSSLSWSHGTAYRKGHSAMWQTKSIVVKASAIPLRLRFPWNATGNMTVKVRTRFTKSFNIRTIILGTHCLGFLSKFQWR
jgi:hypothetical protein